jgi:hypothetical protein
MVLGPAACIFPENQRKLYTAVATDVATDQNAHVGPKLVFARNGNRAFLVYGLEARKCRWSEAACGSEPRPPRGSSCC